MNKAELVAQQLLGGNINKIQWGSAFYNALVEGLSGGGVVDDTAKLQALVDKAIAEGRKAIFFPHGTNGQYYVTALTNADQVIFFGDNASFVGGYSGIISQLGKGGGGSTGVITPEDYDAVGDGVANDSAAIQAAVNAALTSNAKLSFLSDKYYVPTPIKISNDNVNAWSIFEAVGSLSGSAVSVVQSGNPGTTIITNGNSAFEVEFFNFFNESAKFRNLSFRNIGTKAGSVAIHYKFNQTAYARKQLIEDCNFVGFQKGIEFQGLSATFENNYFGTTVIDFCHTYECETGIHFNNAFANLLECGNALFHSCTNGGVLFTGTGGGGIMGFTDSHFEGCEPAGLILGSRVTQISLHNVSAEATGNVSGKGLFDLETGNASAHIIISGNHWRTVVPAFNLSKNCQLTVTGESVNIVSVGGLVNTPESVIIEPSTTLGYSFAMFPLEKMRQPYRGESLNRYAGTTTGRSPGYDADVPASLLPSLSFVTSDSAYDHRVSFGTSTTNRYAVASFIAQMADGDIGFSFGSQFIKSGVTTEIYNLFVQFGLKMPLVFVLVIPVNANADLTQLSLNMRTPTWMTPAYLSLESTTRNMTLSSLGHPIGEEIEKVVSIANGGSYTFAENGVYGAPYAIDARLLLNGGKDGFIAYKFYGVSENGSKYVDVVGASKVAAITVTTANGLHQDLYNVTVANTTGASITVSLRTKYLS